MRIIDRIEQGSVIRLALIAHILLLFPIMNILFPLMYGDYNQRYILYFMKGFPILILAAYIVVRWEDVIKHKKILYFFGGALSLMAVIGFAHGNFLFWYISDLAGVIFCVMLYIYLINDIGDDPQAFKLWLLVFYIFTLIMSFVVLLNYYVHDGGKKWMPPQFEIGMGLVIGHFLLSQSIKNIEYFAILLLAFAVYFSQLRISLALYFGAIILISAYMVFYKKISYSFFMKVAFAIVVMLVAMYTNHGTIIKSRLASLELSRPEKQKSIPVISNSKTAIVPSSKVTPPKNSRTAEKHILFKDKSADQRLIETKLMIQSLGNDYFSWVFGKGAGAVYHNDGYLFKYGEKVHNMHMTPPVILLRNGLIGLMLYGLLNLWIGWRLFTPSKISFLVALSTFLVFGALLTNQFLYWGLFSTAGIALIVASQHMNKDALNFLNTSHFKEGLLKPYKTKKHPEKDK